MSYMEVCDPNVGHVEEEASVKCEQPQRPNLCIIGVPEQEWET